ncbi:hypothetical protein TGCAST_390400, partial [Toxoplasma gondii CAST]
VGQSSCGSERSEFTRFGIRRLWRVAAPHGPAFFPLRGGMRAWGMVDRGPGEKCFAVPPQVTARGPTSLWHELSTCWVWRRHMVRPVYDMRFVECMRGWVRGYWLCVVMQSVWE